MKTPKSIIHLWAIGMAACQCLASEVKQERFGNMPDGREVNIYTLTNKNGLKARVMDYGAILVSMEVPDKAGKTANITHGYDTLDGWLTTTINDHELMLAAPNFLPTDIGLIPTGVIAPVASTPMDFTKPSVIPFSCAASGPDLSASHDSQVHCGVSYSGKRLELSKIRGALHHHHAHP